MKIKDQKGKYELQVDKARRIVYETNIGMWNGEDIKRFHNEYVEKVLPYLGNGNWVKLCDIRKYLPSTTAGADEMKIHIDWAVMNGFVGGVMLVDSATLKMQIKRASKNAQQPEYFDDEKKADEWLRSKGF